MGRNSAKWLIFSLVVLFFVTGAACAESTEANTLAELQAALASGTSGSVRVAERITASPFPPEKAYS